ncbi:TPA: 3-isopropylmalate dehydratase small subunit [Burkholderia cenocepacia]|nr:3-isopropylmalate dehydratase small subunit [Burkholderia cenocepacia]
MQPFVGFDAVVVPLDRANIDTDAIIPKQFMKSVRRTGFGVNLFDEWRYLDHGEPGQDIGTRQPNPNFVLNQTCYSGAKILLARSNFGCGSSREHAVWALSDFGIRALIAPSFADIFYVNCFKNGLLPIVLDEHAVQELFDRIACAPGLCLTIDLEGQYIRQTQGWAASFDIEPERKRRLLRGLDDVALTLEESASIQKYEHARRIVEPWLFS